MKEINPTARYFETNEWVQKSQTNFLVGITDFAQTVFGDIILIELPAIGQVFHQGNSFCVTESNKATNDISMPISGKIIAVNTQLSHHPEWLNEAPYGKGWLVKIAATHPSEWDELMTAAQYADYIGAFFKKR